MDSPINARTWLANANLMKNDRRTFLKSFSYALAGLGVTSMLPWEAVAREQLPFPRPWVRPPSPATASPQKQSPSSKKLEQEGFARIANGRWILIHHGRALVDPIAAERV